jgi:hypothetical protein
VGGGVDAGLVVVGEDIKFNEIIIFKQIMNVVKWVGVSSLLLVSTEGLKNICF